MISGKTGTFTLFWILYSVFAPFTRGNLCGPKQGMFHGNLILAYACELYYTNIDKESGRMQGGLR
jgi:hypothetical protein